MSSFLSIRLTAAETLFLFQLLEIPELEKLMECLGLLKTENMLDEPYGEKVMRQLEDADILSLDNNRITLEFSLLDLMRVCKYSSVTIGLELYGTDGEFSLLYGFIAGTRIVELNWSSTTGEAIFTLLEDGLEEQYSRIGMYLQLPDTAESSGVIRMHAETLQRMKELFGSQNPEVYQAVIQDDYLADDKGTEALIEVCSSLERWGMFEVNIRGTDIHSHPILFISSPIAQWLFLNDRQGIAHGFQVNEIELIQSLYLTTKQTLSQLSPR